MLPFKRSQQRSLPSSRKGNLNQRKISLVFKTSDFSYWIIVLQPSSQRRQVTDVLDGKGGGYIRRNKVKGNNNKYLKNNYWVKVESNKCRENIVHLKNTICFIFSFSKTLLLSVFDRGGVTRASTAVAISRNFAGTRRTGSPGPWRGGSRER